ncbi:MAG: DUF6232 family protein [Micromonosporaceae bacterium]
MPRHSRRTLGRHTYYATDETVVTDSWVFFGQRQLPIGQLRELRIDTARTSRTPLAVAAMALVLPLVSAVSGVRAAQWIVVALITGGTLALAAVLHHRRARQLLLTATIQDQPVIVYWNTDERIFNQVARAVLRAHEAWHSHERRARQQQRRDLPPSPLNRDVKLP